MAFANSDSRADVLGLSDKGYAYNEVHQFTASTFAVDWSGGGAGAALITGGAGAAWAAAGNFQHSPVSFMTDGARPTSSVLFHPLVTAVTQTSAAGNGGQSGYGGIGGAGASDYGGNGGAVGANGDPDKENVSAGGAGGGYKTAARGGNGASTHGYAGGGGGGGGIYNYGNLIHVGVGAAGGAGGSADAESGVGLGGGGGGAGAGGGFVNSVSYCAMKSSTGGNGGDGGAGDSPTPPGPTNVVSCGGGGGGGGGYGVHLSGSSVLYNYAVDAGGNGGAGGNGNPESGSPINGDGGDGGNGGAGVDASSSNSVVNEANGFIRGGNAGSAGVASGVGINGVAGAYGAGIIGSYLTVTNGGTISGGEDAGNTIRGDAIDFTSGISHLTLSSGGIVGTINGDIAVDGTLNIDPGTATGIAVTLTNTIKSYSAGSEPTLDKIGDGTLVLTGIANFDGSTFVSAGTLEIVGPTAVDTSVFIYDNAKLIFDCSATKTGITEVVQTDSATALASLYGGYGDDTFIFLGTFTASDAVNGNAGNDILSLDGDYSAGLVLSSSDLENVEDVALGTGNSYNLTAANSLLASGQRIKIDGSHLQSGATLTFNGAAETSGSFVVYGGAGNDTITTGGGNDKIYAGTGNDIVSAGAGNDLISFPAATGSGIFATSGGRLIAADKIDGGSGSDEVFLQGNYGGSHALVMTATTMINVETLKLTNGDSYNITTADATVASSKTLTVDASALSSAHKLVFDGSAETDGHFKFIGGDGGDVLTGGSQSDTFVYNSAAQSTSTHYDMINGFNFSMDKFNVTGTINKIDTAVSGSISPTSFDTNLAALTSGHLQAQHAILVTVTGSGSLSGDVFLVVDQNGQAGYQHGADLVIELHNATGTLATTDFI